MTDEVEAKKLASRYLAFLWLAFNSANGRFRNFLSYERQWQESEGSEDSHGRALWALGSAINQTVDESLRGLAGRLFELAVPAVMKFTSPRAWAFSLFGIQEYLDRFPGDRSAQRQRNSLADRLLRIYEATRTRDWKWFEDGLAYSNARLSQALLAGGLAHLEPGMGRRRTRVSGMACSPTTVQHERPFCPYRLAGLLP